MDESDEGGSGITRAELLKAAAGVRQGAILLAGRGRRSQSFFMVVSLVNPHDVLLYPKTYESGVSIHGGRDWHQLMAGSGGSQGFPAMALLMASSAVKP